MVVGLSELEDGDRADFERRLEVYGLDASVVEPRLTVQRHSRVQLAYGAGRDTFARPTVLEVSDFDDLDRMIGVDDRVFERAPQRVPVPDPIEIDVKSADRSVRAAPGLPKRGLTHMEEALDHLDIDVLASRELNTIRTAARAYVRGNSSLVKSYKQIIERAIGVVELPVWAYLNVKVSAGSTLAFGSGINVLVAYDIEIENGGRIVSQGHLIVNATKLRKTGEPLVGLLRPVQDVARRTIFGGGLSRG